MYQLASPSMRTASLGPMTGSETHRGVPRYEAGNRGREAWMADSFEFKSEDLSGLVDRRRLAAWLDARGLGAGQALRVDRVSGGMSNETLGLRRGHERWALRRPAKLALEGADQRFVSSLNQKT